MTGVWMILSEGTSNSIGFGCSRRLYIYTSSSNYVCQNWPSQEEMNSSCALDLERTQKIDLIAALTCLNSPLLLLTEKDQ